MLLTRILLKIKYSRCSGFAGLAVHWDGFGTEYLEPNLVPHLLDDPGKEDEGRSDLDCVELDLVEEPVRIEAAALHRTSFSRFLFLFTQ